MGGEGNLTVKVSDLGCASRFSSPDASTWWIDARPAGTPSYLSPEQTTGSPYLGPPADVWSLGVCLFQLATRELPFEGEGILGLYDAIANSELPGHLLDKLPSELAGLLRAMLEKNPASRITVEQAIAHPWLRKYGLGPSSSSASTSSSTSVDLPLSTSATVSSPCHFENVP